MSKVAVKRVGERVQEAVREAMELAEWRNFITKGADVSLKVNLTFDFFLPGAVTSPWVVEGVLQTIRGYVGRIHIIETNQVLVNVDKALHQTRIDELCEKYGAIWVNMSRGRWVKKEMPDNLVLKTVDVPEILTRTELITMPVMKAHSRTVVTGAVKNQWGCLRELRHSYHLVVDKALSDVQATMKPRFAVMDGTVGMEGNGPKSGKPKVADRVLASGDCVALDVTAARMMGFDPSRIAHLQLCAGRGLGVADPTRIEVLGEDIEGLDLGFEPAKNNQVALVEIALRRSFLRRLVFHTPLFWLPVFGAKLWYYVWYYLVAGRKYRDEILYHTRYGEQWLRGSVGVAASRRETH